MPGEFHLAAPAIPARDALDHQSGVTTGPGASFDRAPPRAWGPQRGPAAHAIRTTGAGPSAETTLAPEHFS